MIYQPYPKGILGMYLSALSVVLELFAILNYFDLRNIV